MRPRPEDGPDAAVPEAVGGPTLEAESCPNLRKVKRYTLEVLDLGDFFHAMFADGVFACGLSERDDVVRQGAGLLIPSILCAIWTRRMLMAESATFRPMESRSPDVSAGR